MAMESVLKDLESRIEELVEAYRGAEARSAELEAEVGKLTEQLEGSTDANERVAELEKQRGELATRLEKVVGLIDGVLERDTSG